MRDVQNEGLFHRIWYGLVSSKTLSGVLNRAVVYIH